MTDEIKIGDTVREPLSRDHWVVRDMFLIRGVEHVTLSRPGVKVTEVLHRKLQGLRKVK